jgi:hypothetical protein
MEFDLSNLPSAFGPLPSIHVWQNLFINFFKKVLVVFKKRFQNQVLPLEAASINAPLGSNSTDVMPALLPVREPRSEQLSKEKRSGVKIVS